MGTWISFKFIQAISRIANYSLSSATSSVLLGVKCWVLLSFILFIQFLSFSFFMFILFFRECLSIFERIRSSSVCSKVKIMTLSLNIININFPTTTKKSCCKEKRCRVRKQRLIACKFHKLRYCVKYNQNINLYGKKVFIIF